MHHRLLRLAAAGATLFFAVVALVVGGGGGLGPRRAENLGDSNHRLNDVEQHRSVSRNKTTAIIKYGEPQRARPPTSMVQQRHKEWINETKEKDPLLFSFQQQQEQERHDQSRRQLLFGCGIELVLCRIEYAGLPDKCASDPPDDGGDGGGNFLVELILNIIGFFFPFANDETGAALAEEGASTTAVGDNDRRQLLFFGDWCQDVEDCRKDIENFSCPSPALNCVPTAGACVSTAADIEAQAATASAVVAICAPSTITTNAAITLEQNSVTICCASSDASQCLLQSSGTDSVMEVTGRSITLRNLSFLGGRADSNSGGNVAITGDGSHTISGCIFRNGQASQGGGNLFIDTVDSVLIEGSTFANGQAGRNGGGLYVQNARTVSLKDSFFQSNSAPGGNGGGFFSVLENPTNFGQAIVIDNTDFTGNSAATGGGFYVTELGTLPTLTILNSDFSSNAGTDAAGAGAITESLNNLILTIAGGSGSRNVAPVCPEFMVFFDNSTQPFCIAVNDPRFPPPTPPTAPISPPTAPIAPVSPPTAPTAPTAPVSPPTAPIAPVSPPTAPTAPVSPPTAPIAPVSPPTAPTAPVSPPTAPTCIDSAAELQTVLDVASTKINLPTEIVLCAGELVVTQELQMKNNSNIQVVCETVTATTTPCVINAKGATRLWIGSPARASFTQLAFRNGLVNTVGNTGGLNGGAAHLSGTGTVRFIGCQLVGNQAQRGAALYLTDSVQVTLNNCVVSDNLATRNGGAFYIESGSLTLATGSIVSSNFAQNKGGALYILDGLFTASDTVFTGNSVNLGGGALFFDSANGILADCKFTNNEASTEPDATSGGGAISAFRAGISVANTVFQNNQATLGADILIEDDSDPVTGGGTFVSCSNTENVIFCDGLDGISELLEGVTRNTNCDENGDTIDRAGKCA